MVYCGSAAVCFDKGIVRTVSCEWRLRGTTSTVVSSYHAIFMLLSIKIGNYVVIYSTDTIESTCKVFQQHSAVLLVD